MIFKIILIIASLIFLAYLKLYYFSYKNRLKREFSSLYKKTIKKYYSFTSDEMAYLQKKTLADYFIISSKAKMSFFKTGDNKLLSIIYDDFTIHFENSRSGMESDRELEYLDLKVAKKDQIIFRAFINFKANRINGSILNVVLEKEEELKKLKELYLLYKEIKPTLKMASGHFKMLQKEIKEKNKKEKKSIFRLREAEKKKAFIMAKNTLLGAKDYPKEKTINAKDYQKDLDNF